MRQTMSLPPPRDTALGRAVCAGCRQSLLGDGPSQRYLCNPCVGAWTHTPPRFLDACAHCFSKNIGLTSREIRSAREVLPCAATLQDAVFEAAVICQGRSKIRPPGRWAECLSAVVRTGWSGVWDRPWGGLRRSGNPCAQPRRRGGEASGRRGARVGAGLLAVFEAVAVAVELEDVDVMGQPVEQRAGEAFGAEDLGPFVEGEIRGHER